jgi:hypothetical protein
MQEIAVTYTLIRNGGWVYFGALANSPAPSVSQGRRAGPNNRLCDATDVFRTQPVVSFVAPDRL